MTKIVETIVDMDESALAKKTPKKTEVAVFSLFMETGKKMMMFTLNLIQR